MPKKSGSLFTILSFSCGHYIVYAPMYISLYPGCDKKLVMLSSQQCSQLSHIITFILVNIFVCWCNLWRGFFSLIMYFPSFISYSFVTLFFVLAILLLFQLLVAAIRIFLCSVHFSLYELAAWTTVESLSPTLRPAGRVTMLAVTSHFNRPRGGFYINSWSPRDFPFIVYLCSVLFHHVTMMHFVCITLCSRVTDSVTVLQNERCFS